MRIGNAAHDQFQLDVYGEVMDALHQARSHGLPADDHAWSLQRNLMDFLEGAWDRPDEGIWEVRGPRRHFTHSKVLAWVAFDRAVDTVERFDLPGPIDRWRQIRQTIHDEVCREAFDTERNSFTQSYGSDELDASTLLIPLVGFLPATDPRVVGTIDAIQRDLTRDGFVERYAVKQMNDVDGLPGGEGVFLPCSFWLVDALVMQGRRDEARAALRAAARAPQRPRPDLGGVRPGREAAARQLPAGVHARRARQLGVQPVGAREPERAAPASLLTGGVRGVPTGHLASRPVWWQPLGSALPMSDGAVPDMTQVRTPLAVTEVVRVRE